MIGLRKMFRFRYTMYLICGALCVLFPRAVAALVPYLVGGTMMFTGILMVFLYVRDRRQSDKLSYGSVMAIMGFSFILKGPGSIVPLGTTWAVIGLFKAAKSLNLAVISRNRGEKYAALAAEAAIRTGLALALLFRPFEKMAFHIVVLGLEIIFTSIHLSQGPEAD